jgi:hypothetical protein
MVGFGTLFDLSRRRQRVTGCRVDGVPRTDGLPSIAESRCPAGSIGSSTPTSGPARAVPGTDGSCLVSRSSPVQTAMRNCTRDEGGPFEFDDQVLISSHRKLLSSKAMVVSVAETSGHDPGRHGRERRAQANRRRSVESFIDDVETGGWHVLRDQFGRCPDTARAASGM